MAWYTHPSDNRALTRSDLSVGSANGDADYPAANLADGHVWSRAKLTTGTGYWVWDFGAAVYPLLGSVGWHNFDNALAVVWQGHTSNAWGAPAFSQALVVPSPRSDGATATIWNDFRTVGGYAAPGYRYWRLAVTGVNSAAVSVGEASLWTTVRTLPIRYQFAWHEEHPQIRHTTEFQIVHRYLKHTVLRTWEGETPATEAQRDAILEWHRASASLLGPSLWIPDETKAEAWLVEMATEDGVTPTHEFTDFIPTPFTLTEVSGGRVPR